MIQNIVLVNKSTLEIKTCLSPSGDLPPLTRRGGDLSYKIKNKRTSMKGAVVIIQGCDLHQV